MDYLIISSPFFIIEFNINCLNIDNPGEILSTILISKDNYNNMSGNYIKFSNKKAMDIALLGVSVVCQFDIGKFMDLKTIEGVSSKDGKLSKVQQAFIDEGAIQCGFCTPGLVLTTTALVESGTKYTDDEIKREISGHLCRCTGYQKIFSAVKKSLND